MKAIEIEALLKNALELQHIIVETRDQVHFEITLVSTLFASQSRIARQRMVYSVLGPRIETGDIHAVALKIFTPDEWQQGGAA